MRQMRDVLLALTVLCAAIAVPPAFGEQNRANARLEAMANFLAKAPRLGVTMDCAYDVQQESGEKIEFGERRVVTLRRPDRARIDVARRDGSRRGLLFDGTQLAVFDLDQKVYATVSKPGTVDAAFDYFVDDLNMRLPLRELLKTDFPKELKDVVGSAHLVGEERLGDTATDHVAFRGDTADVQLWIPRDGDPLPRRIVISYRLAGGQPQFRADLSAWNLAPDVPDTLFTFTPAAGAEQIPVVVPGRERKERKP
jgi:hypothetical protein